MYVCMLNVYTCVYISVFAFVQNVPEASETMLGDQGPPGSSRTSSAQGCDFRVSVIGSWMA